MYIKCTEKFGSLMLDNLRLVDTAISTNYEVTIPSKRCCQLNEKGSRSLRSEKSYFQFFIRMLLNFPANGG